MKGVSSPWGGATRLVDGGARSTAEGRGRKLSRKYLRNWFHFGQGFLSINARCYPSGASNGPSDIIKCRAGPPLGLDRVLVGAVKDLSQFLDSSAVFFF